VSHTHQRVAPLRRTSLRLSLVARQLAFLRGALHVTPQRLLA